MRANMNTNISINCVSAELVIANTIIDDNIEITIYTEHGYTYIPTETLSYIKISNIKVISLVSNFKFEITISSPDTPKLTDENIMNDRIIAIFDYIKSIKNLLFSISEFCDNNNDKCVDGATSEVADYLYDKYNTTVDKILYFENKNNMFPSVHLYNSPYVLRLG